MPYQDGTGPFGDGRPGRGLGPCGRFGTPVRGFLGFLTGRWFGRGYGRGRGYRIRGGYGARSRDYDRPGYDYQYEPYPYTKEEIQARKEDLEKQLQWINDQLSKD